MFPKAVSQSRIALSSIASNTGARSPGEELMTCKTSAVAVCCSSASRVSVNSRAFSIAMTTWSAKVETSSICCSVNASTRERLTFAQQWDAEHSSHVAKGNHLRGGVFGVRSDVENVNRPTPEQHAGDKTTVTRALGLGLRKRLVFWKEPKIGSGSIKVALADRERPRVRFAQSHSDLDQRVEHQLQIECRAVDDLQHVARRDLVVERLLEISGALA